MIRTIRLTLANVYEANALLTVHDERGWPSDVEGREPKPMINAVALDHRTIGIDEDRQRKAAGTVIIGHFLGALADDHQDLGS
jgi:hypothetical protein